MYVLNAYQVSTAQGAKDTVEMSQAIELTDWQGMKSTYREMKEEIEAIQNEHRGLRRLPWG